MEEEGGLSRLLGDRAQSPSPQARAGPPGPSASAGVAPGPTRWPPTRGTKAAEATVSPGAAVVGRVLRLPRYRVRGPQGMVLDKGSGAVRVPVRVRCTGRELLTRCRPQPGGLAPAPALSLQPAAPRRLQRGGVWAQTTVRRSTPSPAVSKCANTWMLRCVCTRVCTYVLCVRGCVRAACERQIRGGGAPRPTAPPTLLAPQGCV